MHSAEPVSLRETEPFGAGCVAILADAGREGRGGNTQYFYQPEICPVEVVSSVFISIQTYLRRINKELESFNINKPLLISFSLQISILQIIMI